MLVFCFLLLLALPFFFPPFFENREANEIAATPEAVEAKKELSVHEKKQLEEEQRKREERERRKKEWEEEAKVNVFLYSASDYHKQCTNKKLRLFSKAFLFVKVMAKTTCSFYVE